MVIGRSPECEVCIHDILLSRRHCRIEQEGREWVVADLVSKNGTYLNGQEIGRHVLSDGEAVRIGKTVITFRVGVLPRERGGAAMNKPNQGRQRPADPFEALNETVSGFDYAKSLTQRSERLGSKPRMNLAVPQMAGAGNSLPFPQPMPRDPKSYMSDDVYSLLTELASSSWDSIYMNASRPAPTRVAPRPVVMSSRHPRHRGGHVLIDLSLQATPPPPPRKPPAPPRKSSRWGRVALAAARGLATLGQSVLVLGIAHLLGKI
jgi:pSer/pThr/pTyr-binding forkhead associated (FHA) protein